jgi:hypothetical protein
MTVDYLDIGEWHGYLFAQPHGQATIERAGMCASGEVLADPTYGSWAQWAWNISQTPEGVTSTWSPTSSAIFYDVSTSYREPLRLIVYDQNYTSWCYPLTSSSDVVPLSAFNTNCWDNSGSYYDGTPLMGTMLQVVGSPSADTPFDFCVNDLAPVNLP